MSQTMPASKPITSSKGLTVLRSVFLAFVIAAVILPLFYLVTLTFTPQSEILSGRLIPASLTLDNWPAYWERIPMLTFARNSVLAAVMGTVLSLLIATPVAYAIVRHRTGGGVLPTYVLSAFIAPPVVAIIPMFFLLRYIGLLNNAAGLGLIYGLVNVSVATWLLFSFIERIPVEIEEAAVLDGAGVLRTIWHVVLPLLAPGLAATAIILLILNYNEFLFAVTMSQSVDSQTLPVAISLFQGDRGVQFGQMAAASMTAMIPVYVMALIMQKWLVGGLTSGGVK